MNVPASMNVVPAAHSILCVRERYQRKEENSESRSTKRDKRRKGERGGGVDYRKI